MREFVLGSNKTGSLEQYDNTTVVVGGENPTLQQNAIPGQLGIVYGSPMNNSTFVWPSATRVAFESHVKQAQVTGTDPIVPSPSN